ncbi:conserved hypothetical protein [Leishmania major strain Friedlin]|uniref:FHA domain-containing protein n=1 Tax=Leishmania major TaxID=5664 RepID=E9AEP9_LEIMA|nr:conserved hypothetical protein [Leishmania major strain Friedlin]CAG9582425.1 hypothetical_protein_-_conserved [Leishmania major strain Friedlin]CBZ12702.1 conserved hypothetical protein [Leishmania major strain Friedlin]|eukprot:XP_003722469.1 conserved hypothetical protein [Leishmania major strain Friedlin]
MSRRKASRTAASPVAAASHDSPVSTHPGEPATFQLTVVNSCLCNEDVQLPRLPTPALLTPFYAQYESTAAAASLRTTSPWKSDYWCTKVAHVALGRHSALPAAYRLRHECAGRLHARVVYVQAAAVHRQLYKAYPPLPRCRPHAATVGEVGGDDDVVIVEPTTRGDVVVAGPAGPPPPTAFKASYYLLINHSENPIFVGPDGVPQGRSVVLREGDVLSFLECAFDEDSGVLDEAGATDGGDSAEGHCRDTSIGAEGVECAATTVEQIQQLAAESLWRCVDTSAAGSASRPSSSSTSFTAHQVRVPQGTVATRRFYEVPHVVQEYMRWWHRHTTQLCEQRHVNSRHTASPATEPMGATFSWMVSGNHLVRAPSIANSGVRSVTPVCAKAEGACDISAATVGQLSSSPPPLCSQRRGSRSPSPLPRMQQQQHHRFSEDLLKTPAVVTALRQWLKDTEDMEEVADEVHSPLAARLLLDRAWLWRLVRRHHRQQAAPQLQPSSPAARDGFSPSLVKLEDKTPTTTTTTAGLACAATVKKREGVEPGGTPPQLGGSSSPQRASDMMERFRVSVPTVLDDSVATGHGTSLALTAMPSRAASVVQTVLEELRQSHGKKRSPASEEGTHALLPPLFRNEPKTGTEVARTAPDVSRTLCLDAEPIHVYADSNAHSAARPVSGEASQRPLKRLSSPAVSAGMPTCVPAVRIRPAILPVYVFTRRSPSPDAYTREQSSFTYARSFSSPRVTGRARGGGASGSTSGLGTAKQFVYYYYETDDRPPGADAGAIEHHQSRSRGSTREHGGRWQNGQQRKTTGGGAASDPSPALVEPSSPILTAAALPPHESHADSSTHEDSFLWVDESEKVEKVRCASTTRKRRPGKKTSATRKRRASETIPSAAEAKAARADSTSVAFEAPLPTPTAKSTPSRHAKTTPRINSR